MPGALIREGAKEGISMPYNSNNAERRGNTKRLIDKWRQMIVADKEGKQTDFRKERKPIRLSIENFFKRTSHEES